MSLNTIPLDSQAAEDLLMRLLAVEGLSGREGVIAKTVSDELQRVGVPAASIRFDDAHQRISLPTQTGNLLAYLPGTIPGPRLLFSTHLDTVPLCAGAKPKRQGDRIVAEGPTALGGDNRTGCAVLIMLAAMLLKHKLPRPPITLLFTVREESGIQGAQHLDAAALGGPVMGFNVDGKLASELITGAVGQESWEVDVHGRAAHAGVAPEKGISAMLAAALALGDVHEQGWFGKVVKLEGTGTSNAGIFGGKEGRAAGDATNVVTDYVHVVGESRSSDASFASTITSAYRDAFTKAAAAVTASDGTSASMDFRSHAAYPPFKLDEDAPVIQRAQRAAASMGLHAQTLFSNGGLDANWIAKHGVPTVTIGAGQYEIHTVNEYVEVAEFLQGCRMAIALATSDE